MASLQDALKKSRARLAQMEADERREKEAAAARQKKPSPKRGFFDSLFGKTPERMTTTPEARRRRAEREAMR